MGVDTKTDWTTDRLSQHNFDSDFDSDNIQSPYRQADKVRCPALSAYT
jgi:hypothetical protein